MLPSLDKQVDFCTTETNKLSKNPQDCIPITIDYIDGVAKMKFFAYFVSKQIIHYYDLRRDYMYQFLKLTIKNYNQQNLRIPFELLRLIGEFKSLSVGVSEKLTLYLLKCIFYQLGWAGIKSLRNNEALFWILPTEHRNSKCVSSHNSMFALLKDNFTHNTNPFSTTSPSISSQYCYQSI